MTLICCAFSLRFALKKTIRQASSKQQAQAQAGNRQLDEPKKSFIKTIATKGFPHSVSLWESGPANRYILEASAACSEAIKYFPRLLFAAIKQTIKNLLKKGKTNKLENYKNRKKERIA